MLIIKYEINDGGDHEFRVFDTVNQAAAFFAKNPSYKVRLTAKQDNEVKDQLKKLTEYYGERVSNLQKRQG